MLKTSSTIRSSKNPLLAIDIVETDKVGVGDDGDYKNEMVGRSPSKNLNKATSYLTANAS